MSTPLTRDDAADSMQERIKALLASGDTTGLFELFAAVQTRAAAEATRADAAVEEADRLGEDLRKSKYLNKHLTRLLYGRRSEKLTAEELNQLRLCFESEDGVTLPTPKGADERDDEAPQAEAGPDARSERASAVLGEFRVRGSG